MNSTELMNVNDEYYLNNPSLKRYLERETLENFEDKLDEYKTSYDINFHADNIINIGDYLIFKNNTGERKVIHNLYKVIKITAKFYMCEKVQTIEHKFHSFSEDKNKNLFFYKNQYETIKYTHSTTKNENNKPFRISKKTDNFGRLTTSNYIEKVKSKGIIYKEHYQEFIENDFKFTYEDIYN